MADFLHERRDFDQLLSVVADERGLDPMLVEKDYWIMHSLWGLQAQGFQFELKGGTITRLVAAKVAEILLPETRTLKKVKLVTASQEPGDVSKQLRPLIDAFEKK